MDYLALVNRALQESGSEQDDLTAGTWSSAESGRRIYPRIKRYVSEAWKMIQMERNEWEFQEKELSTLVRPNIRFDTGFGVDANLVGRAFIGDDSGFGFTVDEIVLESGDWVDGDASGTIYFINHTGVNRAVFEEDFKDVTTNYGFVYKGPASYDLGLSQTDLAELQWTTVVAYHLNGVPIPVNYIPYDHAVYEEFSFNTSTNSVAQFVSKTFDGRVVFYPQILTPFRITALYTKTPQVLTDYSDVPEDLQSQYHVWISWRAIMMFATYDKNPSLYAHAERQASFYKQRAEKNLMPNFTWRGSSFNE